LVFLDLLGRGSAASEVSEKAIDIDIELEREREGQGEGVNAPCERELLVTFSTLSREASEAEAGRVVVRGVIALTLGLVVETAVVGNGAEADRMIFGAIK